MTERKQPAPPKPLTQKRLTNLALYYLGRYESSSGNLRRFLSRRAARDRMKGAELPPDIEVWIESVVFKMCQDGYIDDGRFAASTAERARRAGKSERYIREKLKQAGISPEIQETVLTPSGEENADAELEAARRFVRKRKIGPFRPEEERRACRRKDLAAVARAGFSYETALKALEETEEDEDMYNG